MKKGCLKWKMSTNRNCFHDSKFQHGVLVRGGEAVLERAGLGVGTVQDPRGGLKWMIFGFIYHWWFSFSTSTEFDIMNLSGGIDWIWQSEKVGRGWIQCEIQVISHILFTVIPKPFLSDWTLVTGPNYSRIIKVVLTLSFTGISLLRRWRRHSVILR